MTAASDPANTDSFDVKLDAQSLKSASVRGSILIGLAQIAKLFLQIGSQIVLARLLFPGDFGLVAMASPVIGFVGLFASIGLSEAIVQRASLDRAQVSALFWASLALSIFIAVGVCLTAPVVAGLYGEQKVAPLLMVSSAGIPIAALGSVQSALLTRQLRFKSIVAIELVGAVCTTAATVVFAMSGWSYWSLVFGALVGQFVIMIMSWWAAGWRPMRPQSSDKLIDDLKFGGNVTGFNLATFIIQSSDNVIVGVMNGQYALGLYDRSYRLVVQPLGQVMAPIGRVAVPLLSRLNGDDVVFRDTFLGMVRIIMLLTCPAMLVCVVFANDIINVLLGPRWDEAIELFRWIAVAGVTSPLQGPAFWLFISQARMKDLRFFTLSTSFLTLLAFLVGSFWGVRGVAISNALVCTFLTTPLTVYGATRDGAIRANDLIRALVPLLIGTVFALPLLLCYKIYAPSNQILKVALAMGIAYLSYFVVAFWRKDERRKLYALTSIVKKSS